MNLSRAQFDIMDILATKSSSLSANEIEIATGYSLDVIKQELDKLNQEGYIEDGRITSAGIHVMEPYRAKRAIFIAAGYGSRLAPITINTPKPLVRVHGIRIIDRLIDACLDAGINEIYVVRGYLAELFDQLLYKYPMIKFIENPMYSEANNISSALVARDLLANAYVFEADLLISNPAIIKKYHFMSDFLAIKKNKSEDWCFRVENGIIKEEMTSGEGSDIWQMVGISYWSEEDGHKLSEDIAEIYATPDGDKCYWEQVPMVHCKENYKVEIKECKDEDIVEIDTFEELKAIDDKYQL